MLGDRPQAICFDLDGTLIDSEPLWIDAEVSIMREFDADWTQEDQEYCLGGPLSKVGERMSAVASRRASPATMATLLTDRMCELASGVEVPWLPGARQAILTALTWGPVALVTASPRAFVEPIVHAIHEDLGGSKLHTVITGDDVTPTKPHPEPYRQAAARCGSAVHSTLVFEDSVTGCTSAAGAGCVVIARSILPVRDSLPEPLQERVWHVEPTSDWNLEQVWGAHPLHR